MVKQFLQLERDSAGGNSTSNELARHLVREGDQCIAPSHQHVEPSEDRLDSWKDIAAYLRREVRTVQRWEKFEGLPVRRHFHNKVASIYAFKTEIDEWRRGRSPGSWAIVSPRKDPAAGSHMRLSRGKLESQAITLYRAAESLWIGEYEGSLQAIICVAPGLLTATGELKSLFSGNLLAIGSSRKIQMRF